MEDFLKALSVIRLGRAAMVGLILSDTFGVGLLAIFICWPAQFIALDDFKLLMLAVALTLPFVTLGTFFYFIGAIEGGFENIEHVIQSSMIFAVAAHLLTIIGAFLFIGVNALLTSGTWEPRPSTSTVFWGCTALYMLSMILYGLHNQYKKKSLIVLTLAVPLFVILGVFFVAYGAHRGWWTYPATWNPPLQQAANLG